MKTRLSRYLITANEGNAIAVASGYNLATGKIPAVFMQNSGLGNCINPLTSLTNKEVYSVPMILLIGWRGEPGIIDEPQHLLPGKILKNQLDLINIPYFVINHETNISEAVDRMVRKANKLKSPVALIFKKTVSKNMNKKIKKINQDYNRRAAIEQS